MKAELVPENGDPPIPIVRDMTVVGRHEDCDVVISNPGLSKRHCVLVKTDGLLVIRDLATTNGTKVKGQRVRWAALLPDDRISLGGYKMRVYLGSDEVASPSEVWRERRSRKGQTAGATDTTGGTTTAPAATPWPDGGATPAAQRNMAPSFPEPSPIDLPVLHPGNGQEAHPGDARPEVMQFELLDDDIDEIIELE